MLFASFINFAARTITTGHVPMLADRDLCDLIHHIGIASLGADEKQIWHLTKIYWYTVEFGVVREGGHVKV